MDDALRVSMNVWNVYLTGDPFRCPVRPDRVTFKCTEGEFKNGEWIGACFTIAFVLDGLRDCPDSSDECKY